MSGVQAPKPAVGEGSRRSRAIFWVIVLGALAASACAELGGRRRMPARDQDLITAQELNGVNVNNAYDAVLQLRPGWLSSAGRRSSRVPTEIIVAHNNAYFGPVSSLRTFEIEAVKELRYRTAPRRERS
jgi:hypothetical protein